MNNLYAIYVKEEERRLHNYGPWKSQESVSIGAVACDKNNIPYFHEMLTKQEKIGYNNSVYDVVCTLNDVLEYRYNYYVKPLTSYVTLPNESQVIIANGNGYEILNVADVENNDERRYAVLNDSQILCKGSDGKYEIEKVETLIGDAQLIDENKIHMTQIQGDNGVAQEQ